VVVPAAVTAAVAALAVGVSSAAAAPTPTRPVYDAQGRVIQTPFAPAEDEPELTEAKAVAAFLANPKVQDWVRRYPESARSTNADYES
jgi:lauroyl/myristoyl acyltransferase